MKKALRLTAVVFLLLIVTFAGYVGWRLYPHENPQPLPASLISLDSESGQARLTRSQYKNDYNVLNPAWQSQKVASYCGVASGVTFLNAMGDNIDQFSFFTDKASKVRSRFDVTFGGMTLADFAGLLEAHDLDTHLHYASDFTLADFRRTIKNALNNPDKFIAVNYQREVLGQGKVGHISPVAAYDSVTDSVLILDTASYKYPFTWVPLNLLYEAMKEKDPSSDRSRGYVEIFVRGERTPLSYSRVMTQLYSPERSI